MHVTLLKGNRGIIRGGRAPFSDPAVASLVPGAPWREASENRKVALLGIEIREESNAK
jgi:hypothetical protein